MPVPIRRGTIRERVLELVRYELHLHREVVLVDESRLQDLGAGSLDTIELLQAMEDGFGLDLHRDAWKRMATVGDVLRLVEESLGEPLSGTGEVDRIHHELRSWGGD